uniref:Uncharacterized protein n=1 Tax=Alexandrium catenella TaxID=2925 RepID=A0A7S1RKU6_ALECA
MGGYVSDHSPESPLRERRKLSGLTIVKPEMMRAAAVQEGAKASILKDAPVKEVEKASSAPELPAPVEIKAKVSEGGAASSSAAQSSGVQGSVTQVEHLQPPPADEAMRKTSKDANRPRAVNAVRVAASILDPESPRSPGKYSAWK